MKKILLMSLLVMLLAGCGSADNSTLTVFDWSGYELPEFWAEFAAEHPDTEVDFSFFAEDAEAFAKMQTGFAADVLHPCSSWWSLYVENDLVQPLDLSKIPNFDTIPASLAKHGKFDGEQYFVPWDWGYESILVRTDLVPEMPTSWADLWNPMYADKVAVFDSGESNSIVGALAMGLDPYNLSDNENEQLVAKLTDLKPNLLTYWSDFAELAQLMASGDVWVASSAWPDTFIQLLGEDVSVEYITPEEGRMGYVCGFGIPATAENVDLAHDYINATLAEEAMVYLIEEYGYGAANGDAVANADPETVALLALNDAAILNNTVFYESLTAAQRDTMTNNWDRVKAAP